LGLLWTCAGFCGVCAEAFDWASVERQSMSQQPRIIGETNFSCTILRLSGCRHFGGVVELTSEGNL
jgi:hypothetical protein